MKKNSSTFEKAGTFYLGKSYDAKEGKIVDEPIFYNSKDLTTHAICVGMTGSGKTGLGITLLEEAALGSIPSIVIDPKGDMGNILLAFPNLAAEDFKPWIDRGEAERKGETLEAYAAEIAKTWRDGLKAWGETPQRIQDLKNAVTMEIYTPASRAGIPLSILSSFKAPSKEIAFDADALRERVLTTTSSILGLLGIAADPIKSREHILISTIIDKFWREGKDIDLFNLIQEVQKPSLDKIGVLDIETFLPVKERMALSVNLNNLLASPGFKAWMEGAPLDIEKLLYTAEQKPKISVISIAHLSDSERMFFVTLFLNQLISWMRKQPGTSSLRAIFYMDEIFGYFPPTAAPPSKLPMIALLKQARAFGLGMVLCTQNPVDLDYKGLSNCGTWFIGRLQTARDKMRVVEGLAAASNGEIDSKEIDKLIGEIGNRVFIMRSIYEKKPILFQTRWALTYFRGPLTLAQIETLTKNENKEFKDFSSLSTDEDKASEKPIISLAIPQYYVRAQKIDGIRYRPFIAGFYKLHFIDKKYNVDDWVDRCLVAELGDGGINWENAENHPDLMQELSKTPAENANFKKIPSGLLQEKNFALYEKELSSYLYQNETLKILTFSDLKLISNARESEAEFRERVQLALKEKREELIKKLQDKYAKQITTLNEKIRRAQEKKSTQEQQSFYQKVEAFISMATTILGALLGGKKVSRTTIDQAGTTFRRVGRIGKESQDVIIADENLQVLESQLREVEGELQAEVAKIPSCDDASSLRLEEIILRPRKSDITVDKIALVWWP